MKRRSLLKYLGQLGCIVVREGRRHTIVKNPANGAESQVPQTSRDQDTTAKGICKDLGIEPPRES